MDSIGDSTIDEIIAAAARKLAFNLGNVTAKYESHGATVKSFKKKEFTITGRLSLQALARNKEQGEGIQEESVEDLFGHLERNVGKAFLVVQQKHEEFEKTTVSHPDKV